MHLLWMSTGASVPALDAPVRYGDPRRRTSGVRGARPALLLLAAVTTGSCSNDATEPPGGNNGTGGTQTYDHARAPGASARDLLSDESFDQLVVEVQYVEGFPPTDEALETLRTFLGDRLNKPAGIVIRTPEPIQITQQPTYSAADIRALESQHRTVFTEGTTLGLYMLFLNGEYEDNLNVLGIAYNNTSTAIFGGKIRQHTGELTQPSRAKVEATVASHELGHLMGLVANGSDMQVEHQDEENGHHCDVDGCLMYYAVNTTDFVANLFDTQPTLDPNCLEDLRANGGT